MDLDLWIRPFLAGSGSAELQIQMQIQWSDNFNRFLAKFRVIYFFEVWKSVKRFQTYDFFYIGSKFWPKNEIFSNLVNFLMLPLLKKMESANFFAFWIKVSNFEPL